MFYVLIVPTHAKFKTKYEAEIFSYLLKFNRYLVNYTDVNDLRNRINNKAKQLQQYKYKRAKVLSCETQLQKSKSLLITIGNLHFYLNNIEREYIPVNSKTQRNENYNHARN